MSHSPQSVTTVTVTVTMSLSQSVQHPSQTVIVQTCHPCLRILFEDAQLSPSMLAITEMRSIARRALLGFTVPLFVLIQEETTLFCASAEANNRTYCMASTLHIQLF